VPPPPPLPARAQAPLLPRLLPLAEALAPAALAVVVALLLRGCALPGWVRLPAAPSIISAAAIALQADGDAGGSGSGSGSGSGGGGGTEWLSDAAAPSGGALRAPFLPPHLCSAAAKALFVPGAAAPVPLLALLFLWHLGASFLQQPSGKEGSNSSGSGALAQLPRLAVGARIAWNVTRDLGVVLVVLGAVACWEQAWEGGAAAR
jgi:hypothetical protein